VGANRELPTGSGSQRSRRNDVLTHQAGRAFRHLKALTTAIAKIQLACRNHSGDQLPDTLVGAVVLGSPQQHPRCHGAMTVPRNESIL